MTQGKWAPSIPPGASPKYIALADAIERAIELGELKPRDRLPTNRELSQLFNVTIATVTKGMAVATRRGLITAQVGNGTFVSERYAPRREVDVLDLSLNVVPQAVVSKELSRLMSTLNAGAVNEGLFGYSGYAPSEAHASLAAQWMRSFGVDTGSNRILLTTGVHQGLLASFLALLKPGDTAICEDLTYTGIKRIAQFRDVKLLGARCDQDGIVPDHLEELLKKSAAKVIVLTPTLHNPTTAIMPQERRHRVALLCQKYDAYLIEDGVNMPIVGELHPPIAEMIPERAILLTGYSKCVASGFRLGYAIVPPSMQQSFLEELVSIQWTGPHLYSKLAEYMLRDGLVHEFTSAHGADAAARYELARGFIKDIRKVQYPGYHAWVDCSSKHAAENLAMEALRRGVKVSPAAHFAVAADSNQAGPNGYRISLGSCADRATLERALLVLSTIDEHKPTTTATLI